MNIGFNCGTIEILCIFLLDFTISTRIYFLVTGNWIVCTLFQVFEMSTAGYQLKYSYTFRIRHPCRSGGARQFRAI